MYKTNYYQKHLLPDTDLSLRNNTGGLYCCFNAGFKVHCESMFDTVGYVSVTQSDKEAFCGHSNR